MRRDVECVNFLRRASGAWFPRRIFRSVRGFSERACRIHGGIVSRARGGWWKAPGRRIGREGTSLSSGGGRERAHRLLPAAGGGTRRRPRRLGGGGWGGRETSAMRDPVPGLDVFAPTPARPARRSAPGARMIRAAVPRMRIILAPRTRGRGGNSTRGRERDPRAGNAGAGRQVFDAERRELGAAGAEGEARGGGGRAAG